MADGEDAEYSPGSFHVIYKGVKYLSFDREHASCFVFNDSTTGVMNERGEIEVVGVFKRKYTMPPAKTITIKFEDDTSAEYLEGAFDLSYKGEKYLLMGENPLFSASFPKLIGHGAIKGNWVSVFYLVGIRGRCVLNFEKEAAKSSKKRKVLDRRSEEMYEKSKKLAHLKEKKAPGVIELAQRALGTIKELASIEKETRIEAGNQHAKVFEDSHFTLEGAIQSLSRVIRVAEGGKRKD